MMMMQSLVKASSLAFVMGTLALTAGTIISPVLAEAPNPLQQPQLQGNAGSTMLQGGTGSTTLQGGTDSVMLQAGTGSTQLQVGTASTMLQGGAQREAGPANILILLDMSMSMREKLKHDDEGNKVQKIDAAKDVLYKALLKIPSDVKVGLRVFGQAVPSGFDPCSATALLVPPGVNNRGSIMSKIRNLIPTGMTPLTYALHAANESDLARMTGKKTIILISDGQDTCLQDPCSYIRQLHARGINIKIDIVGLNIAEKEARNQLNCIAQASGGQYYNADTSSKLIESISHSVSQAISGQVIIPGQSKIKNPETPPELIPILPMDGSVPPPTMTGQPIAPTPTPPTKPKKGAMDQWLWDLAN